MFSNNKYDFFGRQKGEENPFMGAFDHDGLKRSSGVRPVRDDLREASPMLPDTSNFSGDKDKGGSEPRRNSDFPWFGTPMHHSTYVSSPNPDGENEYSEDSNYVGGPIDTDFKVDPVGMDVTPAEESGSKGLRIGDEKEECGGLSIRPANVSRETKEAQNDPYLHDLDDESQYARNHPQDYDTSSPGFAIMDARAQLLDLDISREIKDYLLSKLNEYSPNAKTSQAGNVGRSVTRSLGKESKLPEKDKKHLGDYWLSVYPKKYTEEMVDDCEVKEPKKTKSTK